MADLRYANDPDGDKNNDDTFGSSMAGIDEDWTPDDSGMGDLNSFMATQRTQASAAPSKPGSHGQASRAPAPVVRTPNGQAAPKKPKAFFDDDDIDTLLTLRPMDLLRSSMTDDTDGDEVDMTSLMRSVAIAAPPPGLGFSDHLQAPYGGGGFAQVRHESMPPGLNPGIATNRHAPIGSPSRGAPPGLAPGQNAMGGYETQQQQQQQPQQQPQVVPKPPQLTAEQLASLTPQQLMHMEQWNLLYQQQQMREVQEQLSAQQAAQKQQQAELMAQHQQLLAQREEAAKRAAVAEEDSNASSEDEEDESGSDNKVSKANRRGRWGGKGTARMSPYEIDLIIRAMEHQVASENPFLDDYYHQNVRIMLNPNNYTVHRPICDVAPPKRRVHDKDPFVGCLGRLSSGSARAPRITVVLGKKFKPSDDDSKTPPPPANQDVYTTLASDRPFTVSLGHMAQPGGVNVSDERRLMLTIENAFVILLELEDLKQLQHLHIQVARQPSLLPKAGELQHQEAQKKDAMIVEHLQQIIELLHIPRMGSPESLPSHPQYAQWEAFILAILRIPKGARMFSRLLLLLPGAVAISVLRVFVRHLPEMARLSLVEENSALVNIGDYIRRVLLQSNLDLLDPLITSLLDDSTSLFAHLKETLATKVGFYVFNAILCRVNDLKGKPDIALDPCIIDFLPKFVKLHSSLLEGTRGQLTALFNIAAQNATARREATVASNVHATPVAPSNPKHIKPLTRTTKNSPFTSEAQMWEFAFYLMLCAQVADKKSIHSELRDELSISSIKPDTHLDIINLKTTFTGVLAQHADPGFEALYQQAQTYAAQAQQQQHTQSKQPQSQQYPQHQHMEQQQRGAPHQQQHQQPHHHMPQMMAPPGFMMPPRHPGQLVGPPPMMMMMPGHHMMPPGAIPPMGFGPLHPPMFPSMPPGLAVPGPQPQQTQADTKK